MNNEGKKPCLGCGQIHDDDEHGEGVVISDETREKFHKDLRDWTDHLHSLKAEDIKSLILVKEVRDPANPDAGTASAVFGGTPAAVGETILGLLFDFMKRYPASAPYMAMMTLSAVQKLGGADLAVIPVGDGASQEDIDAAVAAALDKIKVETSSHTKH